MNIAKYTAEWLIFLTITNSKTGICTKLTTFGIKKNKTQRLITKHYNGTDLEMRKMRCHRRGGQPDLGILIVYTNGALHCRN
jgi:hypothetical protein